MFAVMMFCARILLLEFRVWSSSLNCPASAPFAAAICACSCQWVTQLTASLRGPRLQILTTILVVVAKLLRTNTLKTCQSEHQTTLCANHASLHWRHLLT